MKHFALALALVSSGIAAHAQIVCVDNQGGSYVVSNGSLVCMNNACSAPSVPHSSLRATGLLAQLGGRVMTSFRTDLRSITNQNDDVLGSSLIFEREGQDETNTLFACAPNQSAADAERNGSVSRAILY